MSILRFVALAAIAANAVPVIASTPSLTRSEETHCVVEVLGEHPDGEFIVSEPVCHDTFTAAVAYVTGEDASFPSTWSGPALVGGVWDAEELFASSLGVHFDGTGGTGSSITLAGSTCTGGHWNTGAAWANRISSSWNGCHRLRHYDLPGKGGASESTVGAGATHNLGPLNNKTESVAYLSS